MRHSIEAITVEGTEDGIDFDGRYKLKGDKYAIAYWLVGWEGEHKPTICFALDEEGEEIEVEDWEETELVSTGQVVGVMVGDDRRHVIDPADLIPLADEDYCGSCGQVGCGWC